METSCLSQGAYSLPGAKKSLAVTMSFRAVGRILKRQRSERRFRRYPEIEQRKTDYQIRK